MKDLSKPQQDKDIATVEYVLANGSGTDLLPTDLMTSPTKIFTEILFDSATGNINTKYLNDIGVIVSQAIDLPSVFASKTVMEAALTGVQSDMTALENKVNQTVDTSISNINTNIGSINKEIAQIKQDIGGYATRLETANNGIKAKL